MRWELQKKEITQIITNMSVAILLLLLFPIFSWWAPTLVAIHQIWWVFIAISISDKDICKLNGKTGDKKANMQEVIISQMPTKLSLQLLKFSDD